MTYETTDKATYGTSTQGNRHLDLYRQVRRKAENAPGENWNVSGRTCRKVGNLPDNAFQLGIQYQSTAHRSTAGTCGSLTNQGSDALTRCLKENSLRNFEKNPKNGILSIDIIPLLGYNSRITLGSDFFLADFPCFSSERNQFSVFDRSFTSTPLRYRQEVGAGLF